MIILFYCLRAALKTVRQSAELNSQMSTNNYFSNIQENSEIELHLDELQTSKMQKISSDTMEVMI